jgi:hypothetical protein
MSAPDMPPTTRTAQPLASDLPTRRRFLTPRLLLPLALLAALLVTGGIYTALNLPRQCGLFGAARHGLACEVPLPAGAMYQSEATQSGIPVWAFLDASTSYQRLHDFFAQQLPSNGWGCVQDHSDLTTLPGAPTVSAMGVFIGIQSGQALSITFAYGTLTEASPQPSGTSVASMQIIYGLASVPAGACHA